MVHLGTKFHTPSSKGSPSQSKPNGKEKTRTTAKLLFYTVQWNNF